jgi:hypothetical protein
MQTHLVWVGFARTPVFHLFQSDYSAIFSLFKRDIGSTNTLIESNLEGTSSVPKRIVHVLSWQSTDSLEQLFPGSLELVLIVE